jgi:subtilisin-like proprotein convertase family protein/subtilisin family serine protease
MRKKKKSSVSKSGQRNQKRRSRLGSTQYQKLEPRNLLASLKGAYVPAPISDPFVQDAVTYNDMVDRAKAFSHMPGELVVAISSSAQGQQFEDYLQSVNWNQFVGGHLLVDNAVESNRVMMTVERGENSIALVHLHFADKSIDVFPIMEQLQNNGAVLWSSPNFYQTGEFREFTPDDPQYSSQYHHLLMQNDLAWDTTLGDSNIIVGITDDGVELTHEDLASNIFVNSGEIAGDLIDNDGNGYVDDANGWDFINDNNDANPSGGDAHGTHVSGISAGTTNNGIGIAGTSGGSTILPLKFFEGGAAWPAAAINETFTYAADSGAHIVNTSYNINGWVGDAVFTSGLQYMYDAGVLAINSAGNGSELNPARQSFHQTLLVASSEADDTLSGFTNYGTGVDIVSPGGSILSTLPGNTYGENSGTSMAAPNAAGVAALIWSANPTWSRDQVAAQLIGTGDNIDAENPTRVGLMGGGRTNSFAALNTTLDAPQLVSADGLPGDGVFLDDTTIDSFTLRFDQVMDPASINDFSNFELRSAGADNLFGTADDVIHPVSHSGYMISTNNLEFTIDDGPMDYGFYQFTISGNVQNPFGTAIDGDGNGTGGDAYVQEFYISPPLLGELAFDSSGYLVDSTIGISVGDANVTGSSVQVTITSTGGDSETLTLAASGAVLFEGSITSTGGTVAADDGTLQVALGDVLTVTYVDADDGFGNTATVTDTAIINNVIEFPAGDVPVDIIDNGSITSTITVGVDGILMDLDLQLDVTHTFVGDLDANLTSPDGTVIELFNRIGGGDDNFQVTYFDDEADTSINDGVAPYDGSFRPSQAFTGFDGLLVAGDWTLTITDNAGADTGTLNDWSLFLDIVPVTQGIVGFDANGYELGADVGISVSDANVGASSVDVVVTSSSGDSETLTLASAGGIEFSGIVGTASGTVAAEDGTLQVALGDVLTVTYVDSDDGTGSSTTSTDTANITNVVEFPSSDVPVDILDNSTIISTITVGASGTLADIDLQLDVTHTFVGDLDFTLTGPDGTVITLIDRVGGSGDNFQVTYLDDEAGSAISNGTAPFDGSFRPTEAFTAFDGISITGDWTLAITDNVAADEGTLNAWSLFIDVIPDNSTTPELLSRNIYYVDSSFTGTGDFDAVATDKQPLLPGETATFANYSSYSRGINGMAFEVNNLNQVPTLATIGDYFEFHVGNDNDVANWAVAPTPIGVIYEADVNGLGTDRVFVQWADNAIENQWLQITAVASTNSGLASEVFYFGNQIGETGNDPNSTQVNLIDVGLARVNQTGFTTASIDNAYDFNRDERVNLVDVAIARSNQSGFTTLNLITPPASRAATDAGDKVDDSVPSFATNPVVTTRIDNAFSSQQFDRLFNSAQIELGLAGSVERLGSTKVDSVAIEFKSQSTSTAPTKTSSFDAAFSELESILK